MSDAASSDRGKLSQRIPYLSRKHAGTSIETLDDSYFHEEDDHQAIDIEVDRVPLPSRVSKRVGALGNKALEGSRWLRRYGALSRSRPESTLSDLFLQDQLVTDSTSPTDSTYSLADPTRTSSIDTAATGASIDSTEKKRSLHRQVLARISGKPPVKFPHIFSRRQDARKNAFLQVIETESSSWVFDILYENQRGGIILGFPRFSSQALAQADPAPWCNAFMKDSHYTPHNYPLPDPSWVWVYPEWMIDMGGDVDEQGWVYSPSFRTGYWRYDVAFWRSFVRRRRWLRLRFKSSQKVPRSPSTSAVSEVTWNIDDEGPIPSVLMRNINPSDPIITKSQISDMLRLPVHSDDADRLILEVNRRRIAKFLSACATDHERITTWKTWLSKYVPMNNETYSKPSTISVESKAEIMISLLCDNLAAFVQGFEFQQSMHELRSLLSSLSIEYDAFPRLQYYVDKNSSNNSSNEP